MSLDNIDRKLHPLLWEIARGARWRNHPEYPSCREWADFYEHLLEFVKDKGELARFLPRLQDDERPV